MFIIFNYIFNSSMKTNVSLFSLKLIQNLSLFLMLNLKKYLNFMLMKDNQMHIFINKDNMHSVCFILKNSLYTFCNQLLDITVVDSMEFLKDGYSWEFIYVLLSTYLNLSMFMSGYLKYYQNLSSVVDMYKSSNWLEREMWDMFGVYFKNHPDLRRILTDYAFLGSPLSKDFPLTGYVETRYDDELKMMVTEPLELTQELSEFSLENPWKW